MPSPFPGMDPYLEGARRMGVHGQLVAEIARQLAPLLRPRYVAVMGERVVVEVPPDLAAADAGQPPATFRYPDVSVVERAGKTRGATATVAPAPAPLRLATVMPEAVPHYTVEIRDVAENRLVTAIEVLSPTNKRGEGREEYLAKRRRLLLSDAHLIEIDLLRPGQRVPMRQDLPPAPYFVFVSRADARPVTDVWPVALDQPLPTVPVPLLPGDADVPLDLQRALTSVYDLVGYDLLLDYGRPPDAALRPEELAWADDLLKTAGKRP
jgi:hypothetical protein